MRLWRRFLGLPPKYEQKPVENLTISVVVPAYNEERTIASTILSLKKQTRKINKIIVVDDCSNDRTGEIARGLGVTVLRPSKNQGTKAQAQNYALPYIDTDLMVTVDADTLLDSNAIERTLAYFSDPDMASVCGFVVPQKITTIWEKGRFIEYLFGLFIFKGAQRNLGVPLVCSGCFSVFRTDKMKKIGGFQPRTMAEDMDLTWEFLSRGEKVEFVSNAFCYPLDPPTFPIFIAQINRWYRSFFQNISIHKKDIFRNKKLAFFIYWYLLDGLLLPLILFFGLYYLTKGNISWALIWLLGLEFLFVAVPVLFQGWKINKFWLTLKSLPAYFIIRPVNIFVYYKSFFQEWVLKQKLTAWEKGH
jgi:biofilm PGA synthesis N-glycosyltransferase PgaC